MLQPGFIPGFFFKLSPLVEVVKLVSPQALISADADLRISLTTSGAN
jgi:hypothetical protein